MILNTLAYIKITILTFVIMFNTNVNSFPIPKNNEAEYDIIRKNKIIGSHKINFINSDDGLIVETNINIKVKVLLITAYQFSHTSKELWKDGDFVKIEAHTDFEDEREYFIKGQDKDDLFIASGMDGELQLQKNILPSNFWNIKILNEEELFDTQKGIVRKIIVQKLDDEILKINNQEIKTEKYLLDASTNPKDKGPFPQYTLWYDEKSELIKMKFTNWKDKKEVITLRNNLDN